MNKKYSIQLNLFQKLPCSTNIIEDLSSISLKIIDKYEDYRGLFIYYTCHIGQYYNIENVDNITKELDQLLKKDKSIRYNMMIHDKEKKWPSSIRINKRGKKIITKQQTKYLCMPVS